MDDPRDSDDTFSFEVGSGEEALGASANLFRGLIVASFAHVEYVLTDFVVRCSTIREYGEAMPATLPYRLEKRLKLAHSIFTALGPFFQYQREMLPLIDRLLSFADVRHMMVHGLMIYHHAAENPASSKLVFTRYDFGPKNVLQVYRIELSLEQLGERQLAICRYAAEVVDRLTRILGETGLSAAPVVFDE